MVGILSLALLATFQLVSSGPVVETTLGKLEGWNGVSRNGRTYQAWTKVPYALPPVGDLRFKDPQPPTKWTGYLKAIYDTPICMQKLDVPPEWVPRSPVPTEDCLYLSIYRPDNTPWINLPVLVYIHGGAFTGGVVGGKNSADYLMDENVILVQVNYRLNAFGFSSLGDNNIAGNMGLKDQVQALRWIKNNIASFGGNPKSITVFGGSTGGASAHYLLKSPLTENLVTRVASHSGSINHVSAILPLEFVKYNTLYVANEVGCYKESNDLIMECLQEVSAADLLNATLSIGDDPLQSHFGPIIETDVVKKPFATQDLSLRISTKPWMTTISNAEHNLYNFLLSSKLDYLQEAKENISEYLTNFLNTLLDKEINVQKGVQILIKNYFSQPLNDNDFLDQLAKLHADCNILYPALFNINAHKGPKWLGVVEYSSRISGKSPSLYHAGHDAFTGFILNDADEFETVSPDFDSISSRVIKYLVNFATYGDPTPVGVTVRWSQFNSFEMLRINHNTDKIGSGQFFTPYKNIFYLWRAVLGWK